ncbi:2933_t:CDS:2, partial [Racocetra persica]
WYNKITYDSQEEVVISIASKRDDIIKALNMQKKAVNLAFKAGHEDELNKLLQD